MTAYVPVNTIRLRGNKGHRDERIGSGVIKPGHLLKVNSTDKVVVHDGFGTKAERLFAVEDAWQGNLATTSYADGDLIFTYSALPGDIIQARAPSGGVALSPGDFVISNGDGCLVKSLIVGDSLLYSNTAASAATTPVTTAETDYPTVQTSIAANTLKAGDVLRIKAQGHLTTTSSTDTVIIKLYLGSTAIVTTAAVDAANADTFNINADVVIRTIGASGTFVVDAFYGVGTPGEATTVVEKVSPFFLGSTAIDTTAAKTIKVSQTWSGNAGSAAVSRLDVLTVELKRTGSEDLIGVVKLDSGYTVDPTSAESFFPLRVF